MAIPNEKLPFFLIASPSLDGTTFERSVILIVQWSLEGVLGFIINFPIQLKDLRIAGESITLGQLTELINESERPTHFGGPVNAGGVWMLDTKFSAFNDEDILRMTKEVDESESDEGTVDYIRSHFFEKVESLGNGRLIFLGHSAWDDEQLKQELSEGSWYILEFQKDIFLRTNQFDPNESFDSIEFRNSVWEECLDRLGLSNTLLGRSPDNPKIQ